MTGGSTERADVQMAVDFALQVADVQAPALKRGVMREPIDPTVRLDALAVADAAVSLAAALRAAEEALRNLHNEVDCRIEHGANSNGHLEYVRDKLAAALAAASTEGADGG